MTTNELLTSKGRDIMSDRTAQHLAKHAGELSSLVAECHGQARRELGTDATADALARRAAIHVLNRIGQLPVKPRKETAETQRAAEDAQPKKKPLRPSAPSAVKETTPPAE